MTNANTATNNTAYAAMYRKQIGEAQASILEMWEIIKAEGETEDLLQELADLYQDLHGAEANLKAVS